MFRSVLFVTLWSVTALAADGGAAPAAPADPLLEPVPAAEQQLSSWEEALKLFHERSTDLRIAAAEVVRAAGRRRQALGVLLPQASGQALASFSLLPTPAGEQGTTAALFGAAPYQTVGLVASLAVIEPRGWNALALAYDAEDATRLAVGDAKRLLMLNLAQALLSAVTAERLAELNRVGLRDALSRLALAERSSRAGASTDLDLGRTRQDAELQRAQVVSADETLRQSREALGLALGVDVPVSVRPDFKLDGLADQVLGPCRVIAGLDQRSDVLAAKARVEVAHRGVLDVKSQFLPSVAVRSQAQAFVIPGTGVFPIWNLQAVLTVPIWDGGSRYGALKDAHAQEAQAEARREAAERAGRIDVERARRGVQVALKSRELAQKALTESERIDALTRKAFDAGIGTSLELVTAASQLRQQQLALALKDYDVLRARVVALFALADCSS